MMTKPRTLSKIEQVMAQGDLSDRIYELFMWDAYAQVLPLIDKYINRLPFYCSGYLFKAKAYRGLQEPKNEEDILLKGWQVATVCPEEICHAYVDFLWRHSRYHEALEVCKKGFALYGKDGHLHFLECLNLQSLGRYHDSWKAINNAMDVLEERAIYYHFSARANANIRNKSNAYRDYTLALRLEPNAFRYAARADYLYYDCKKYRKAWEDYTLVIKWGKPQWAENYDKCKKLARRECFNQLKTYVSKSRFTYVIRLAYKAFPLAESEREIRWLKSLITQNWKHYLNSDDLKLLCYHSRHALTSHNWSTTYLEQLKKIEVLFDECWHEGELPEIYNEVCEVSYLVEKSLPEDKMDYLYSLQEEVHLHDDW